jgi:hypothetical protein
MMGTDTYRGNEAGFMNTVIEVAQLYGWMVAHFRPSQNKFGEWRTAVQADGKGFPDLFMVRAKTGHAMAAELKVGANKPTPEQETWLASMNAAGIPAFLWRPTDWEWIERVLRDGPLPSGRREADTVGDVLRVIRALATSKAVTDTIWMPSVTAVHVSATDVLAGVAARHGATDMEIEEATGAAIADRN